MEWKEFTYGLMFGMLVGMGLFYLFIHTTITDIKVNNFVETTCDNIRNVEIGNCTVVITGMLSNNSQLTIDTNRPVEIGYSTFIMNNGGNTWFNLT